MNRCAVFALILATCPAFADGDDRPKGPVPSDAKKEPAAPAPLPADSEPIRGVRYKITLKSGRTITGVVTSPGVFERRDSGSAWSKSEQDALGSGIRLFFMNGQDGFIFLTAKEIRAAERIGDITEDEGREIAQQRAAAPRRAAEERDRIKRDRAAREELERAKVAGDADESRQRVAETERPKTPAPGVAPGLPVVVPADQLARYTALLVKYPPGRWTPDTPKEIERRRIVMDLFPTDEEKQFLVVYDQWVEAFKAWEAGQEKPKSKDTTETAPAAPAPAK